MLLLYFLPEKQARISFCPSVLTGLGPCPGCGIGRAIHYALHFEWGQSWQNHMMGIPAVIIIFSRIKQLLHLSTNHYETQSD
ncbi:DUF2752 domain-containing protein [Sediminibacterium sp. WSJ-3]|nr:DUF2752 domain-containing protein [Sediminibacterium soli]